MDKLWHSYNLMLHMRKALRTSFLVALSVLFFGLYTDQSATAGRLNYTYNRSVDFNIERQPLSNALIQFGRQAELTIILPKSYVKELTAPALKGRVSLLKALEHLLADTELGYKFVDKVTVSISPEHYRPKTAPADAPKAVAEQAAPDSLMPIEEVIVTSQRRSQNLQEVPKAVSVLGDGKLKDAAIVDLGGVAARAPGLTVTYFSLGQPLIHIRGIGSNDDGAALDSSVAVYLDDIYVGRISAIDLHLLDVERVEVLRGPQGTLYGRNTIGGAINVIRKRPDNDPALDISASLGNLDQFDMSVVANGPLGNRSWLGRLALSGAGINGWQKNIITGDYQHGRENYSVHSGLAYVPRGNLTFDLDLDYSRDNLDTTGRIPVVSRVPVRLLDDQGNPIPQLDNMGIPILDSQGEPLFETALPSQIFKDLGGSPNRATNGGEGYTDRTIWGVTGKLTRDTSWGAISSITGYRNSDFEWLEDATGLPVSVTDQTTNSLVIEHHRQFSQELRWATGTDKQLSYVVGLYYLYEQTERRESFTFPQGIGITDQDNSTNSYAVFGQLDYSLDVDMVLSLGARYTSDTKRLGQLSANNGAPAIILESFQLQNKGHWEDFSPTLALSWQVDKDMLLYGNISRGFKSGGFQGAPGTLASAMREIDPEQVWNFELGMKSEWLDNRLRLNIAAFYSRFRGLQVVQFRTQDNFGLFETSNAGSATLRGVETEFIVRLSRELSMTGSYAWLSARYDEFDDISGRDFTGNRLRQAPKHSLDFALNYEKTFDWGTMRAGIDYRYQSKTFREPDNDITQQPAYDLLDLRLGYISADGQWEASLWTRNTLDEEYIAHLYVLGGNDYGLYGKPRTYGITLSWHYR